MFKITVVLFILLQISVVKGDVFMMLRFFCHREVTEIPNIVSPPKNLPNIARPLLLKSEDSEEGSKWSTSLKIFNNGLNKLKRGKKQVFAISKLQYNQTTSWL